MLLSPELRGIGILGGGVGFGTAILSAYALRSHRGGRRGSIPRDDFEQLEQPRCPNCGTVLVDDGPVYRCRSCGYVAVE